MATSDPAIDALVEVMGSAKRRHVDEHATEIGYVTISWNRLHGILALLYAVISGQVRYYHVALAAWGALISDRSQREMLLAATLVSLPESNPYRKEIKWALGKIHRLEIDRNNTIHAPYVIRYLEDGTQRLEINDVPGNRQARELKGKELRTELQYLRDTTDALADFMLEISKALRSGNVPALPARPPVKRPAHSQTQDKRTPGTKRK